MIFTSAMTVPTLLLAFTQICSSLLHLTSGQEVPSRLRESHKMNCLPYEVDETNCLHNGSCFAIEVLDPKSKSGDFIRMIQCQCTAKFEGPRCQYQAIAPDLKVAQVPVGPLVILCIALLLLLVIMFAVYLLNGRGTKCRYTDSQNPHIVNLYTNSSLQS